MSIVEKELSYKVIGILFSVHNQLGNRFQEKYYQRAIEEALKSNGIQFQREIVVDLLFDNKKIGKYFLDFFIEDKIILECKAVPCFTPQDFKQVLAYLKVKNIELGILANFRTEKLQYKRVLNSQYTSNIRIHSE